MGIDIYLQYEFPLDLIKRNLLLLLDLGEKPERVIIANDYNLPGLKSLKDGSCDLFVQSTQVRGEVSQMLELYFRNGENIDMELLAAQLCNKMHCFCLISDQTVNPYSWIKINRDGSRCTVLLEGDALDDHDEFILMPRENMGPS